MISSCLKTYVVKVLSVSSRQILSTQNKSSYFVVSRYSSNFFPNYNQDQVSRYSSYLLKLHEKVSSYNKSRKLQACDCLPLLYDELGGKPVVAYERIEELASLAKQIEENETQLKELSSLAQDSDGEKEFLNEIQLEADALQKDIADLKTTFIESLIQDKELQQCDGAILEVRAGVGGEEATLFAMEVYEMYIRFVSRHGLDIQEVSSDTEDSGGLLRASCIITSPDGYAYEMLRHEAGIHRVQRVPKTESRGRIHTSTASVAIIPKLDTSSFELNPNEIEKHFSFSPGGGGQHVNKTLSCVSVRHIPTGIQVKCHATRVQIENYNRAMEQLKQILFKKYFDEKLSQTNAVRKQQIQSRERSDKIRTYNFPNNRVTDHRIGYTVHGSVETFLTGGSGLSSMLQALNDKYIENDKVAVFNELLKEANIK